MAWYPTADKSVKGNNAGSYTGGPFKGVLHSTEGSSASGAIGAFKANNSWPHFLIDYAGKVWQFIDTNKAARALRHPSGTIETNRDSAVQIEVVGFAGKPNEHPVAQWNALKTLMRWIETTHGVKPIGPGRPFASAYGQNNLRFTSVEWDKADFWMGHCHIVNQTHWDPGQINLQSLLPPVNSEVKPMYSPPLNMGEVVASLPRPGGAVVLNKEGAIYAFFCRDAGAPNRHPEYWNYPVQKAVGLYPLGDTGYYVIAEGATDEVGSAGWYAYS